MFTGNLEFLFCELLVYIVYLSSSTELFLINFKGFFKEQECKSLSHIWKNIYFLQKKGVEN